LRVTEFFPGRPVPEQTSVYACAEAPCNCTVLEPEALRAPDQAPLAVQEVAFEVVQVRVALCPGMTEAGVTFIVTIALATG